MSADIIPLRPRSDAPVQRLPIAEPEKLFGEAGEFVPISDLSRPWDGPVRRHFGRKTGAELSASDAVERVKRAAVSAAEQYALGGERKHVCPTLDCDLASQINHLARIARDIAEQAKALGHAHQAVTMRSLADHAETCAAEIEANHLPEGAA